MTPEMLERYRKREEVVGRLMQARVRAEGKHPKPFADSKTPPPSHAMLAVLGFLAIQTEPVTTREVADGIDYLPSLASHRVSSCLARGYVRRAGRKQTRTGPVLSYEITEEGRACLAVQ